MLVMVSVAVPELVSVTFCAALGVFTVWLPKLRLAVDRSHAGHCGCSRAGQADGLRTAGGVVGDGNRAGLAASSRGRERDADGAVRPRRQRKRRRCWSESTVALAAMLVMVSAAVPGLVRVTV